MKKNKIDEYLKKIAKEFDADRVTLTIFFKKNKRNKLGNVFEYFGKNMKEFKK